MKAWKYGLTLVLGLSMGLGAQVFAQASGQTAVVTPENPNTLPEISSTMGQQSEMSSQGEQRGIPTPKYIEDMVTEGKFVEAETEFNKFIKKAKGDPCNLLYLRMSFYARLMRDDVANAQAHQTKRDEYIAELEKTCPNMADLYILKATIDPNQTPENIIYWMNKAAEVDKSYSFIYSMRGEAYRVLGQTEKACADFKKVKELDPDYTNYYYDTYCVSPSAASDAN